VWVVEVVEVVVEVVEVVVWVMVCVIRDGALTVSLRRHPIHRPSIASVHRVRPSSSSPHPRRRPISVVVIWESSKSAPSWKSSVAAVIKTAAGPA
ncbi:hypothetical protein BDZ89DRAFT_1082132, partial [Hymenopellis radicata]